MSHSYGTVRQVCNKWCLHGFSSLNSHNTLNQRETFSENHFHFDFIIYIWSQEIP